MVFRRGPCQAAGLSALLLVAASPREFRGIAGRVRVRSDDVRWMASAKLPCGDALLAANGIGEALAGAATIALLEKHRVRAVVSTGFAGSLRLGLEVGDILVASAVVAEGARYRCRLPRRVPREARTGVLRTVDRIIVSARDKLRLGGDGARAVDMEAAAVARAAAAAQVPFYCVRAISDSAARDLPVDFNAALRADGSLSRVAVLRQACATKGAWAGLARLERDTRTAAKSLGRFLRHCRFHP